MIRNNNVTMNSDGDKKEGKSVCEIKQQQHTHRWTRNGERGEGGVSVATKAGGFKCPTSEKLRRPTSTYPSEEMIMVSIGFSFHNGLQNKAVAFNFLLGRLQFTVKGLFIYLFIYFKWFWAKKRFFLF